MRVKRSRPIAVRAAPGDVRRALVSLAHGVRPAALGRSGIGALKREGDGATPLGRFLVRQVLYRADRIPRPRTELPVRAIRAGDGWCDNPADRNYNRLVKLSPDSSADRLTRSDRLYDLIIVLGYNDRPRIRGKGSAIFVHLARPGYAPTAGCIALTRHDLTMLLAELQRGSSVMVMR
jgi:L,D-peptidoglycan transpeptidase YkuD (ErfK/YbiS/YcfS/YnhG family)